MLRIFDRLANNLTALLLGTIVIISLLAVFFRYVMNDSLYWSDEIVRYLFVWLTMLGAVIVFRDRQHIRVLYFLTLLPDKLRHVLEMMSLVLTILFFLAMTVLGFLWVFETRASLTSTLQWPLNWFFYAALPLTSLTGVLCGIRRLVRGEFGELEQLEEIGQLDQEEVE